MQQDRVTSVPHKLLYFIIIMGQVMDMNHISFGHSKHARATDHVEIVFPNFFACSVARVCLSWLVTPLMPRALMIFFSYITYIQTSSTKIMTIHFITWLNKSYGRTYERPSPENDQKQGTSFLDFLQGQSQC